MKPNILLITIDALRADAAACYGATHADTPTLDHLAAGGVRFIRVLTNGDHTKVAFPGLFTSTYGSMYTGCLSPLSPQRPALAALLREGGYHTAAIVSSPLLGRDYGYDRGFDVFQEFNPEPVGALWYRMKGAQRLLRQPSTHRILGLAGVDTRMPPLYADATQVTDEALELLPKLSSPFVLWLHYMDAYWPYHLEKGTHDADELARAWQDMHITYRAAQAHIVPPEEVVERLRALYAGAISCVDREIGRLLSMLEHMKMPEDTVVVVTSDHGEAFYEHGVFGHAYLHLYNEILHVPLIVRGPGLPAGVSEDTPVQLMDLPPTLLEIAGQPVPDIMLGRSLVPMWKESSFDQRPYLISEAVGTRLIWIAVTSERYKFIWAPAEPENYELYDLVADPGEQINLRGRLPEVEREMLAVAHQHKQFAEASQQEAGEAPELDESVVERLRALGYLD